MSANIQAQALTNATSRQSTMNYAAIFEGFTAKGIPADQIVPRENVFTFHAWKALGRSVKKGEHGVRVVTFVPVPGKVDTQTGEVKNGYRKPHGTTVFHVSQTEPSKDAPQIVKPEAEPTLEELREELKDFAVPQYEIRAFDGVADLGMFGGSL